MSKKHQTDEFSTTSEALKALLLALPESLEANSVAATAHRRRLLRDEIKVVIERLHGLAAQLDPIVNPPVVFDPTDPVTIGRLIAETLLDQPRHALESIPRFYGAGVYAIYYNGSFQPYSPIKLTDHPIYIGKADPDDAEATTPERQGDRLWQRLVKDHAKSISHVENLELDDFECRYLVVKSRWQKTAEDYLIGKLKPVWNTEMKVCYGFSKHGDAATTRGNSRSPWDTLHPGRKWAWLAGNKDNRFSAQDITNRIGEHFRRHPPSQ